MRRLPWIVCLVLTAPSAAPLRASTYFPTEKVCPVGGEKFKFMALGSISTFGRFPDGMPIGSGVFPVAFPECPGNGLAMYRDFDSAEVKRLGAIVDTPNYQALRGTETPYYRAFRLATALGDEQRRSWLLLAATWEAKRAGTTDPRAIRYAKEFIALAAAAPVDARSLDSIALRLRAANALREFGRFDEAERLRAAIVVAPDADTDKDEVAGWTKMVAALAAPIARRDAARMPIDLAGDREAARRCLAPERKDDAKEPPLTTFETNYCARPALAAAIAQLRQWMP